MVNQAFKQAFGDIKPMIAYGMKALDTTVILKILQERGCSLKVTNLHEMERAQRAISDCETRILESMEAIEAGTASVSEVEVEAEDGNRDAVVEVKTGDTVEVFTVDDLEDGEERVFRAESEGEI